MSTLYPAPGSAGRATHSITATDPLGAVGRFLNNMPATGSVDSLRIVALRVEFVEDNVATTTGNGKFDLSEVSDAVFDKPPHNKTYFERQLLGLSNYFKRVSKNKLVINSDVFPAEENSAYQLDQDMVFYSGQEDEDLQKKRWAQLLSDAVSKADTPEGPDFSQYDVVIVFHAGVGSDIALDFDSTPYDIQSVFLDFESLKQTLAPEDDNFQGIRTAANRYIKEGIILPETQNQEGIDLGLLGTMTLLVGSQLGMPNLYNTDTGSAGIGRWGLMDQGSFNLQGLVPAEPCAWTKIYMGWEQAVVLPRGEDLKVAVSKSTTAPHIYKIPITSEEYFLIENRQKDFNGDGVTFGRDREGNRVQIDTLGQVTADPGLGVVISVDEYDFGLPGSGILIWHIDDRVIREKLVSNTINNDPERRGVDLVESDGAQDIGFQYNMFQAGYGTEAGDYWDPYWAGNVSHKTVNENAEFVELSPTSIPNSNSNDNANTHLRFYGFGNRDSVMTFSVSSELRLSGFPQFVGGGFGPGSLVSLTIGAQKALAAVRTDGKILAWKQDGVGLVDNSLVVTVQDSLTKLSVDYPFALFAEASDSVQLPISAADLDKDGRDEIVVVDKTGLVYLWKTVDSDMDGLADLLSSFQLAGIPTAGPMIRENEYITVATFDAGSAWITHISYNNGSLTSTTIPSGNEKIIGMADLGYPKTVIVSESGNVKLLSESELWQRDLIPGLDSKISTPLVADFDGDSKTEIAVLEGIGALYFLDQEGNSMSLAEKSFVTNVSPALGDVDRDGLPDILVRTSSRLEVLKLDGLPVLNYPVSITPDGHSEKFSSPVFVGSKNGYAAVVISGGLVHAFDSDGTSGPDFPLAGGGQFSATPLFMDLDLDSENELFVLSNDGFLYAWDLAFETNGLAQWTQFGGNKNRTFAILTPNALVAGSSDLLSSAKVFCYPNPAENNRTNIHYSLGRKADRISIKIYDLAGDFVTELPARGLSAGDHEVPWNVSDVESGVYLARVYAESASQQKVEFVKIAVIK